MKTSEEKKYYIRPKGMNVGNYVFNYDGVWCTSSVDETEETSTKFTRKEIKELTGQALEHYSYCEVGTDTWIN